jgi:hypothetical protein
MIAVVLAVVLLAAGLCYVRARVFLSTARSADAEVFGLRPYREGSTTRHLQRLQFRVGEEVVETELRAGIPYDIGTHLQVFFKPGDPRHVTVKPLLYRPVFVLLIIAALVLAGWLVGLLRHG